jgi:hypothetical protein
MRELYDKDGNSHLVPDNQVQDKLRSGWVFFKKPESVKAEKKSIKIKSTTRPRATMRITKAEAEVIKPFNEEDN